MISHTHNRFMALWILSGRTWVSCYRKKHSPTHIYHGRHPLSASSMCCDPLHPLCSIHAPDNLFPQSFFKFSLVSLLAWPPPLHLLHRFLHPITAFFSQHMPIPLQPVCCSTEIMSSNPSLSQPFTWNSVL